MPQCPRSNHGAPMVEIQRCRVARLTRCILNCEPHHATWAWSIPSPRPTRNGASRLLLPRFKPYKRCGRISLPKNETKRMKRNRFAPHYLSVKSREAGILYPGGSTPIPLCPSRRIRACPERARMRLPSLRGQTISREDLCPVQFASPAVPEDSPPDSAASPISHAKSNRPWSAPPAG